MSESPEVIHSRIWDETPEADNPFAAAACYCAGYDVYGELLGQAGWIEYLYLLFNGEKPTASQARLLEVLAIALANPGPREASVHAAMCGGVGGSTHAACLMAALAVGAGQLGGAHEVARAMAIWQACGQNLTAWRDYLQHPPQEQRADIWLPMEHPPGFDPHGASCATPVRQTLAALVGCHRSDAATTSDAEPPLPVGEGWGEGHPQKPGRCRAQQGAGALTWLHEHREALEQAADCPLAMSGVAAAAMVDLALNSDQAEMLYLLLRLPGAAVHALEQKGYGWRRFPFFAKGLELVDAPVSHS